MPASVIKSWSDKYNIPKSELENKWKEAKKQATEQGHRDDYDYVMGIFKKMTQKDRATESRKNLRNFIMENIPSVDEGLLKGVASLAATPLRMAAAPVKGVARMATAPVKATAKGVKGVAKTTGQLATGQFGKAAKTAIKTPGKMAKATLSPVTGRIKDVTKPIRAFKK